MAAPGSCLPKVPFTSLGFILGLSQPLVIRVFFVVSGKPVLDHLNIYPALAEVNIAQDAVVEIPFSPFYLDLLAE